MKYDSKANQDKNSKPKQGKNCDEMTNKKKEDSAIAFLVVDNARAKDKGLGPTVESFKDLLWPHCKPIGKGCHSHGTYDVYEIINGNEEPPCDQYCEKVIIQTRSIMQTLVLMCELIHVPHDEKNAVRKVSENASSKLFKNFNIYSNDECPQNAFVAIKYCGHWFFIDSQDIYSKLIFSSILGVLSMAETGTTTGVPILTLPVR